MGVMIDRLVKFQLSIAVDVSSEVTVSRMAAQVTRKPSIGQVVLRYMIRRD